LAKKASSDKVVYTSGGFYGSAVEAWAPVLDSDGNLAVMVEGDLSLDVVMDTLVANVRVIVLISCAIIIVLIAVLILFVRGMITRPLSTLTQAALEFVSGNSLSYVSTIKTGDEMQTLSEALAKMSGDIGNYTKRIAAVAATEERLATERKIVGDIRASLLPGSVAEGDGYSVCGQILESDDIGGSFYDFFPIDGDHLCAVAAEASGAGMPAALRMVVAETMIKDQMSIEAPMVESMNTLNTRFYKSGMGGLSVFAGILEISSGRFTYVNAGQGAPLFMREGGDYEFLSSPPSSAMGGQENVAYRQMALALSYGDRLLLLNGGAAALVNQAGEAYGEQGLRTFFNDPKNKRADLAALQMRFKEELEVYAGGLPRIRDITSLLLAYTKNSKVRAEIAVPALADSFVRVSDFLKRQLSENRLAGAFKANVLVTAEELFVIAVGRTNVNAYITVRCAVSDNRCEISLLYGGRLENPLETDNRKDLDALAFIRKHSESLRYENRDGANAVVIVKSIAGRDREQL